MSDTPETQEPTEDPLADLQAQNAEKIQTCMRRNIQLDPLAQLKMRLDVLTEFTVSGPVREQFEYAYESLMGQYLDSAIESRPNLIVPATR